MRTVALLLALTLAGCLGPIEGRLRASDVEPPHWRVGDWWTYELTSQTFDTAGEVTLVVANATGDGYVLGVPADADVTAALLQHLPAIGPVRDDLSYEVHERRFEPLRWPLSDGLSWETTWITATVHLTAHIENETWNVTNDGFEEDDLGRYDIVYDPARGAIASFARTGLDGRVRVKVEMTANGTGYVGDVRAPGNIEVVLLESRTRGTIAGTLPEAPNPNFTPREGIDTLLVGCLAGGAPGQYHAEVRSPTGVVCALDQSVAPGDSLIRAQIVEAPWEEGEWEARLAAIGTGSSTAEVLGYATQTYTLA